MNKTAVRVCVYSTDSQSTASNVSTYINIEYLQNKMVKVHRKRIKSSHIQRTSVPTSTPGYVQGERTWGRGCICSCRYRVQSSTGFLFTVTASYNRDYVLRVIILRCQWLRFFMLTRLICSGIDRVLNQSINQSINKSIDSS